MSNISFDVFNKENVNTKIPVRKKQELLKAVALGFILKDESELTQNIIKFGLKESEEKNEVENKAKTKTLICTLE